jgi:hypothetical protein
MVVVCSAAKVGRDSRAPGKKRSPAEGEAGEVRQSFPVPAGGGRFGPSQARLMQIVPWAARIALDAREKARLSAKILRTGRSQRLRDPISSTIRALHVHITADDCAHVISACLAHDVDVRCQGRRRGGFRGCFQ